MSDGILGKLIGVEDSGEEELFLKTISQPNGNQE
jgi:hypothetical protein